MKKMIGILILTASIAVAALAQRSGGAPQSVDLLITGGTIVTMDAAYHVYENGFVAVRGDRIVAIGDGSSGGASRFRARQTINAAGRAILPGLINTHTHIPMVLFRGIADDLQLQEWLEKFIFPAEAKNVDRQFVASGTRLGLAEMIRGGTTTYVDMYYFEDEIARETKKAGVRAVLGETVLDFPAPDNKTWSAALAYTERFLQQWKGDPLIVPAIAPHAPYTVSTAHLNEARSLAERHNSPIIIHIAEAPTETEFMAKTYGERSVPYLDRIGFLSSRVIAAHVVHVNDDEIETLRRREVGVAHCPQSNMKLASGVAPVPQMLAAGLRLGLGTDGAASNNDLNLWEEADAAAKLHKLTSRNPTVVSAREALTMATIGGARAIHLEREIGSLEVGKRADVVLVDLSGSRLAPMYNIYSHLVYAVKASDVTDSIINGRAIMRSRRLLTLDEGAAKVEARRYRQQIAASLKSGK
jgi:5-methylthioadenosine/S-adenosylhomocysteine deaminase